ncbi:MAG: hypothetical protein VKM34_10480, partial [Cyanobacteriota bacterium]|nr:hypothetical protein [Cyanobacteriota bacterium]
SGAGAASPQDKPQAKKEAETFFLEPDAASSLGDVNFMRRSNTIRHTFPGTASSPGNKELVEEVASMEAELTKVTPGLGGVEPQEVEINLTGGVPKPVKKTFAKPMSAAELEQRKKGSAVAVNAPGAAPASKKNQAEAASGQPQISQLNNAKPGSIDPFKQMVKDLRS